MKHRKYGRKFGRVKKQREAMLRTMLGSFLARERMKTTEAKAKELKVLTEKIIGAAKKISGPGGKKNPAKIKLLKSRLPRNVKTETLEKIAEKFTNRQSGFTRVIKLGQRRSDGAKMAVIELVK